MTGRVRMVGMVGMVAVMLLVGVPAGHAAPVGDGARTSGVTVAQVAANDILGLWDLGSTQVKVIRSGSRYVGTLRGPLYFGDQSCSLRTGTRYWTLTGTGKGTYVGTQVWVTTDDGACATSTKKARFRLRVNWTGYQELTVTIPAVGKTYQILRRP